MDTLHYQDKHNSLCILPKAAEAVTLNHRAACLTRPTDVEQKHALALPLKSQEFHMDSAQMLHGSDALQ